AAVQDATKDSERAIRCRHAAVHRRLQQHLRDLRVRETVPLRSVQMELELVEASLRDERRQRDAAAHAAVEPRPGPDLSPRVTGDEVLEVVRLLHRLLDGTVDVRVAEHFATDLESPLVRVVGHAGVLSPRCASNAPVNASGCSTLTRCAAPGMETRRVSGMPCKSASTVAGGPAESSSPT